MTGAFVHDEFSRRHLRAWFDAGHAPYDWGLGDLEDFDRWMSVNAEHWPEDASWPTLASWFENNEKEPKNV